MTEFTPEWIAKARERMKHISPLPWKACSCGKCGQVSNKIDCVAKATIGDWGDDYPSIRRIGGSIEGRFETYMEQITYGTVSKDEGISNAKYIAEACNNYPKALDEIERLQDLMLAYENDLVLLSVYGKLERAEERIAELEAQRRWIHQDKTMIVKKDGDSWCFVLPDFINLQESEAKFMDAVLSSFIDRIYTNLLPHPPKEVE